MLFSFSCVSDFKKLHVWQKAHALSLCVDRVCKQIRGSRYASLRSQLFRAATSRPVVFSLQFPGRLSSVCG